MKLDRSDTRILGGPAGRRPTHGGGTRRSGRPVPNPLRTAHSRPGTGRRHRGLCGDCQPGAPGPEVQAFVQVKLQQHADDVVMTFPAGTGQVR